MRTHIQRAMVAALVVPVLMWSTACSGGSGDGSGRSDGGDGRGDGRGDKSGDSRGDKSGDEDGDRGRGQEGGKAAGGGPGRASGTPPLSEAGLRQALLTQADVPGYAVRRGPADALPAAATVTADRPECRPIADTIGSRPKYPRTAYTSGSLTKGDLSGGGGGTLSQLLLAAYRGNNAEKWVTELRRAVEVCRSFTATGGAGGRESLAISPGRNLTVGDTSVTFLMRDKAGKSAPVVITVVRTGGNTATFISGGTSGKAEPVARAVAYEQHRRIVEVGKVSR
ncbi:hypothetical protein [Streptomyces zagrosensis]|uniref:Lipoprotein n=1 Tax=Streptomyces zagrosensis TaxID=1042984 RepID=A0A7W9QDH1_9ACTN|nr:hypothetical protein [Streptomyces zagrosensis]MBB5938276.1 hypothetical protein [Streptomyces zagrosensis]